MLPVVGLVLAALVATDPGGLEILYHADLDGHFAAPPCGHRQRTTGPDYAALVGALGDERDRARARGAEPLTLLGGNALAPALFARHLLEDADGASTMVELLSAGHYDAIALGHHELSLDPGRLDDLLRRLRARNVPVVASNLRCERGRATCGLIRTEALIRRGDETLGVLATISPDVLPEVAAAARGGLLLDEPAEAIRAGVRRLRARGATRVVVMAQGPRDASALARVDALARELGTNRAAGAPELILAGGLATTESGGTLQLLRGAGTAPVVGAFAGTTLVARIQLSPLLIDDLRVSSARPDATVTALLRRREESYCARYGPSLLARPLAAPLSREDFTKILLEVMRRRAGAEVALINRGAVRAAPFPLRDEVSAADLGEALPYAALVGVATVPGTLVDSALGPTLVNSKAALAGLTRGAAGLEVNGRPLDRTRAYRVATISFVAEGGDQLLPAGTLHWTALPEAPELRAAVSTFMQAQAGGAATSVDLARTLGASPNDRLLVVGLTDFGFDFADTDIRNPSNYGDAQLTRAQQASLSGQASGVLQFRLPRHQDDTRLDLKYGWTRTRAAGAGMPVAASETADLVTFTSVYSYRGLRDLRGRLRSYVPDPYARLWIESELTRPAVTATQPRNYHHLEAQGTAGTIFTVLPRLKLRGGAGARRELLATSPDDRWRPVLEAGVTLEPTALATFGAMAIKLEGLVDYTFIDPASQRDHELRTTSKLSVPLLPPLFLTAGFDLFGTQREGHGWAFAADTTIGLRVHFDAAHQRQ
ncbi:MAG: hypothetical protein JWM82_1881 [Myxococcales bacterium]|nr:hypothetical protein [Myxococcales bacterium]